MTTIIQDTLKLKKAVESLPKPKTVQDIEVFHKSLIEILESFLEIFIEHFESEQTTLELLNDETLKTELLQARKRVRERGGGIPAEKVYEELGI